MVMRINTRPENLIKFNHVDLFTWGCSVRVNAHKTDLCCDSTIQMAIEDLIELNPHLEHYCTARYVNAFGRAEALVYFRERKKTFWQRLFSNK